MVDFEFLYTTSTYLLNANWNIILLKKFAIDILININLILFSGWSENFNAFLHFTIHLNNAGQNLFISRSLKNLANTNTEGNFNRKPLGQTSQKIQCHPKTIGLYSDDSCLATRLLASFWSRVEETSW